MTGTRTVPWRDAMAAALYGSTGFYIQNRPASAFRTSSVASPLFATAILRLLERVDELLGHPESLDVVDVGAGRGELLAAVSAAAPASLSERLRLSGVELAPRPADGPARIRWQASLPEVGAVTGLLLAAEWLDNVPLDIAICANDGWRYLAVEPDSGTESAGPPLRPEDALWISRWWPRDNQERVELGGERDRAWAAAVASVGRGLALAIDYGHLRANRPGWTVTGYRDGRQVAPTLDGGTDITAAVAIDSVAAAGWSAGAPVPQLLRQRTALRALGMSARRPAIELAHRDPHDYVRRLAEASAAGELIDRDGLGSHWWLLQPVGISLRLNDSGTSDDRPAGSPPPAG